jgi:hypothetical protein
MVMLADIPIERIKKDVILEINHDRSISGGGSFKPRRI